MLKKRYQFKSTKYPNGVEGWVWVTWFFILFSMITVGFGVIGYVVGKHEERGYFSPLVTGLIKQVDDKCTSTPWKKRSPKPKN